MNNGIITIETNQTGLEGDIRAGNRGVSPLEITHSDHLRKYDPELYHELISTQTLETIRQNVFSLLFKREMSPYSSDCKLDSLERSNALYCINVLKNMFSQRNEEVSNHSTLLTMLEMIRDSPRKIRRNAGQPTISSTSRWVRWVSLTSTGKRRPLPMGAKRAMVRSDHLDVLAEKCMYKINSYHTGLEPKINIQKGVEPRPDNEISGGGRGRLGRLPVATKARLQGCPLHRQDRAALERRGGGDRTGQHARTAVRHHPLLSFPVRPEPFPRP